jgi:hypothetical protein
MFTWKYRAYKYQVDRNLEVTGGPGVRGEDWKNESGN